MPTTQAGGHRCQWTAWFSPAAWNREPCSSSGNWLASTAENCDLGAHISWRLNAGTPATLQVSHAPGRVVPHHAGQVAAEVDPADSHCQPGLWIGLLDPRKQKWPHGFVVPAAGVVEVFSRRLGVRRRRAGLGRRGCCRSSSARGCASSGRQGRAGHGGIAGHAGRGPVGRRQLPRGIPSAS